MVKYILEQRIILYYSYVNNKSLKEGFVISTLVNVFQFHQRFSNW
jgi:hypothetical protein